MLSVVDEYIDTARFLDRLTEARLDRLFIAEPR
jgi:hypothetical protein